MLDPSIAPHAPDNAYGPTHFNVYVDGSWLFKQCNGKTGLLAKLAQTKPHFPLDFQKLLLLLKNEAEKRVSPEIVQGDLFFYMELIKGVPQGNGDPEIRKLRQLVYVRREFAKRAVKAGFKAAGVISRAYKPWMPEALRKNEYQEKRADTSLVARMVEQGLKHSNNLAHIVVSGDSDMLPGVEMVVPGYSKHVIWVMNDPRKHPPELAQSSSTVSAGYGCVYLDRFVSSLQ